MAKNDATKLPKWAQEELVSLRRQVADDRHYWKNKALEAASVATSNTQLVTHYGEEPRALPNNTAVRFVLGDASEREWVEVVIRDGKLHVMGGDCLQVLPVASNVVQILSKRVP